MLLRCLDEARLRSREAPRCQAATASPSAPACDAHLGHPHERLSRSWIQTAWQWAPGHHDSTAACRAVLRQFHFPPPGSTAACGSAALGLPSHLASSTALCLGGWKRPLNGAPPDVLCAKLRTSSLTLQLTVFQLDHNESSKEERPRPPARGRRFCEAERCGSRDVTSALC